jgi:type IX secretion system PorP/SprF family membrane protein
MKKAIIIIATVFIAFLANAQEINMSQYSFNGFNWNAGYAGSTNYIRFAASYRQRVNSSAGKVNTAMFSADMPLQNKNMGLGFQAATEQIGVNKTTAFYASYAYQVRFNKNTALGLGMKAGVSNYSADFDQLLVWDAGDEHFTNNNKNQMIPQVGLGACLHGKNFYAGVSMPTVYAYDANKNDATQAKPWNNKNILFSGAYVINLSKDINIKPAVFGNYSTSNKTLTADVNMTLGYKNIVAVTMGYRSNNATTAMVEVRPLSSLRIAYAYELTSANNMKAFGGNTHEILLGYDLMAKNSKYLSNRYF